MQYIKATIFTSAAGLEPLTALLARHDVSQLEIDDPLELSRLQAAGDSCPWDDIDETLLFRQSEEPQPEVTVSFYLEDTAAGKQRLQEVKLDVMKLKDQELEGMFGPGNSLGRLCLEENKVQEEDWRDQWKQYWKPFRMTDRLTVRPGWEPYEKQSEEEILIELDPGMAFGTGAHETTALCAALLEETLDEGQTVLDIGCGSGILSIAAVLLGASRVTALDLDETALAVTRENAEKNGTLARTDIRKSDLAADVNIRVDIVVANLMAELIITLSGHVRRKMNEGGRLIVSGILHEKKEAVADALRRNGFQIDKILEEREWCAISAR